MSLQTNYAAGLAIPGIPLIIGFEKWAGGDIESDETKYRSAASRKETARGGMSSRQNVTLSRECDAATWALKDALSDCAGVEPCTAVRQMLDNRGSPVGAPMTVTGIVKAIKWPDFDLSSSAVGLLEIEVSADE